MKHLSQVVTESKKTNYSIKLANLILRRSEISDYKVSPEGVVEVPEGDAEYAVDELINHFPDLEMSDEPVKGKRTINLGI